MADPVRTRDLGQLFTQQLAAWATEGLLGGWEPLFEAADARTDLANAIMSPEFQEVVDDWGQMYDPEAAAGLF